MLRSWKVGGNKIIFLYIVGYIKVRVLIKKLATSTTDKSRY